MHCIVWIWFEWIRKGIKELLGGATQNIPFGMTCPVADAQTVPTSGDVDNFLTTR